MIKLEDDYIIDVDVMGYTAKIDKHKQDKSGKDVFEIVGYYPTLEMAIQGVYESKARKYLSVNVTTLHGAITALNRIKNDLSYEINTALNGGE